MKFLMWHDNQELKLESLVTVTYSVLVLYNISKSKHSLRPKSDANTSTFACWALVKTIFIVKGKIK